ncbi:MAG: phosphatase PAP2 family protein [Saprospiraceae bacterium]|nr:phosphatase PAP2 family protein [Candidatus Brachybacter algidus]
MKWLWILWALSIGFAQVYVGVHYPLDVLCGFLYGGLIGYISIRLFIKFFPSFFTNERAFY